MSYDGLLKRQACSFDMDNSVDGQTRLAWNCPKDASYLAQAVTDVSENVYLLSGVLP